MTQSDESQEKRNLAVVQRFIDGAINGGTPDVIDDTWAEDLVWNGGSLGTHNGREAFKASFRTATAAFEGMHLTVQEAITSGDRVILRFTNSGTNVGPFMNTTATGKRAEWLGIGIYTVRDGRITEGWFAEDIFGLSLQLGILTVPVYRSRNSKPLPVQGDPSCQSSTQPTRS
jgi:predicted ester cyclase